MSDELPPMEQIIPAVEHVMGSLDHDAGLIQAVADKLVQAPGATIDTDKATLKQVKNRLTRAATWSVVKDTGPILSEIGGRMRAAVAVPVDSDQQRIDALSTRLPPMLERPLPGGGPSPPIVVPPAGAPGGYVTGYWACVDERSGEQPVWVWYGMRGGLNDETIPPFGPPQGGDPNGHGVRIGATALGWHWLNRDGSIALCGSIPPGPPPVPILPPPVPILPPPVPIGPPIIVPPVPMPPPSPVPVASPCGPLPTGIPSVAVYVVPWLDQGDTSPSVWSECGQKLVADSLYLMEPAQALADALTSPEAFDEYIGGPVTLYSGRV